MGRMGGRGRMRFWAVKVETGAETSSPWRSQKRQAGIPLAEVFEYGVSAVFFIRRVNVITAVRGPLPGGQADFHPFYAGGRGQFSGRELPFRFRDGGAQHGSAGV